MKKEFKELANIFEKMRDLCDKVSRADRSPLGFNQFDAFYTLKDAIRKIEGCLRKMRTDMRKDMGQAQRKIDRESPKKPKKALGSPKPKAKKPKKPKDGFFAGKVKEIPSYHHSDFKTLEEYIEAMRRPPISDKEVEETDWDNWFKEGK